MTAQSRFLERIGPTWEWDATHGVFVLPERTLGWEFLNFVVEWLTNGEPENSAKAGPFRPTPEQIRFALWWYALEEDGSFCSDEGVLQRLKGWGKDPMVTILALFEAFGNCRFNGWHPDDPTVPLAKPQANPDPNVMIAATTQVQTGITMKLFRAYLSKKAKRAWKVEVNTEAVKRDGLAVIQSVTSNPEALEGQVSTFTICNETHHWTTPTSKEMWSVIVRNATKGAGGTSRVLSITNAFDPAMNSVAQMTRHSYETDLIQHGESRILYDSREISPSAPLFIYLKDEQGRDTDDLDTEATKANIVELLKLSRGDSHWSDLQKICRQFLDVRNPPDQMRRFYLNTIVSSEDAWVNVNDVDACIKATQEKVQPLKKSDKIAIFFDGSKTDDSTVLVGCRISDGLIFEIASWHKPPRDGKDLTTRWLVPRHERDKARYARQKEMNPYANMETADDAVQRAFKDWTVVGFFADPSHAREDVSNRAYWDEIIQEWHVKYRDKLKVWAGPRSGPRTDAITWDMSDSKKLEEFAEAAMKVCEMIHRHDLLLLDPQGRIRSHMMHARVYKTRQENESIWKGKNHNDKIDLAVGAIGAYHVRDLYLKQVGTGRTTSYNYWANRA